MKKLLAGLSAAALLLVGCGANNTASTTETTADENNKIVVGVSPVPHGEIVEALQPEFEKAGLDVEVVKFDDYVQPNEQLAAGDLDCNYFQHVPYLEEFTAQNNLELTSIGKVHIEPIGFYSSKITTLDELKDGDEVIIPNDPTNGARALILLDQAGVIKLADNTNLSSTEKDIVENPKNLKFQPLDAQNITNVYEDAALAAINSNFALGAGLNPTEDAIVLEAADSPYANIVAVRTGEEGDARFQKFLEVLNSDAAKKFIEEKYEGAVIPAF